MRRQLSTLATTARATAGRLGRQLAWPWLVLSPAAILATGFARDDATLYFNLSYAWLVLWLLLAERLLPIDRPGGSTMGNSAPTSPIPC